MIMFELLSLAPTLLAEQGENRRTDWRSYGISGPSGSRVVGSVTVTRALWLLERCAPAQGVAEVAGVLARCWNRRQRVSGHVVFLGGHDAAHQDEGLLVHGMTPFQIGGGAAISFVNNRDRGPGSVPLLCGTKPLFCAPGP